jgi:Ser/Thr protein kinase RdoA (MazF antagonist)
VGLIPAHTIQKHEVLNAAAQFMTGVFIDRAIPVETGHINNTFYLYSEFSQQPKYVLQQINSTVFPDVEKLMENILTVTRHLQSAANQATQTKAFLKVIPANNGSAYWRGHDGICWRCFNYIPNRPPASDAIDESIACEGGKLLGEFQRLLSDLPHTRLHPTIADFHNLQIRFSSFEKAIWSASSDRLIKAKEEITFFENAFNPLLEVMTKNNLPLRVTHNDTKFNNILFGINSNALCFIDLDTVMPGYSMYDFGDAIRTLANTSKEDESDRQKIDFRLDLFAGFAKGYLETTKGMLTCEELSLLAWSTKLMTFMIGIRFLTDYLTNDRYYKTGYPDHNLVRAINQITFYEKLDANMEQMEGFINSYKTH